jgi:hypothetical protein
MTLAGDGFALLRYLAFIFLACQEDDPTTAEKKHKHPTHSTKVTSFHTLLFPNKAVHLKIIEKTEIL